MVFIILHHESLSGKIDNHRSDFFHLFKSLSLYSSILMCLRPLLSFLLLPIGWKRDLLRIHPSAHAEYHGKSSEPALEFLVVGPQFRRLHDYPAEVFQTL